MKKSRFISILVSIALIGCALSKDEKDKLIPVFQPDLLLTQDEEARDLLSATRGDPCAAFRLSEHYWALNRKEEMTFWLKKAAVWGHPIAQYNLGVFYEKYFEPRDADGAQYWFARAKGAERESAKCSP